MNELDPDQEYASVIPLLEGIAYLGQGNFQESKQNIENYINNRIYKDFIVLYMLFPDNREYNIRVLSYSVYNQLYKYNNFKYINFGPLYQYKYYNVRYSDNLLSSYSYSFPYFFLLEYINSVLENIAKSSSESNAIVVYRSLGDLYYSENKPERALTYYQKSYELASQLNLNDATSQIEALNGIGKAANALGDTSMTRQAYEEAVALATQHPSLEYEDLVEIYYQLGLLNFEEGQFEQAIKNLSEALQLDPKHKEAYFMRAQAYFEVDEIEAAINNLRTAIQFDSEWVEPHLALAHYLVIANQHEQAMETLTTIETEARYNPLYHHYLGYAYISQGERSLALTSYETSFQNIGIFRSNRTELYEKITDELRQLERVKPSTNQIIEEIWPMMREELTANSNQPAYYNYALESEKESVKASNYMDGELTLNSPEAIATTEPVTQTMWLQLAAVGPEQIPPGSSDTIELFAELREYPDRGGTAFSVELYQDNSYSVEIDPTILNFEVAGDLSPEELIQPLEVGKPVRWKWVLSPKQGYEGNQKVIYDVIVRDSDNNGLVQAIPTNAISVSVPTRYGIPGQLVAPISLIAVVLALVLMRPLVPSGFGQRRQQVTTQYNAAGNIIIGTADKNAQLLSSLEKLARDATTAISAAAIDEESATDAKYQLDKAIHQAKKATPDQNLILDHLSNAKSHLNAQTPDLIEAITEVENLVQTLGEVSAK